MFASTYVSYDINERMYTCIYDTVAVTWVFWGIGSPQTSAKLALLGRIFTCY